MLAREGMVGAVSKHMVRVDISTLSCAKFLEQYMWARNRVGNELSHRPASLCSLAGRYDNPIPRLGFSPSKIVFKFQHWRAGTETPWGRGGGQHIVGQTEVGGWCWFSNLKHWTMYYTAAHTWQSLKSTAIICTYTDCGVYITLEYM
jgi:hypothetical protein